MLANEGENLYGSGIAVLVWVLKALLAFGALTLLVAIVLVGGMSLLRRSHPKDAEEL